MACRVNLSIEHHQVESAGRNLGIVHPTMQRIENSHSVRVQPDNLGVDNRGAFYASRVPDNQRITLRPLSAVDGVEAHPPISNMDLEPIAIVLQFVRPARSRRRLLGGDWLTRMDESGWRIKGPAA